MDVSTCIAIPRRDRRCEVRGIPVVLDALARRDERLLRRSSVGPHPLAEQGRVVATQPKSTHKLQHECVRKVFFENKKAPLNTYNVSFSLREREREKEMKRREDKGTGDTKRRNS